MDTFGDSALNARPFSLTGVTTPKISGWTETAGFNMGGPLKIPHIYDGSDKTFYYINVGGTWTRSPVDSFSTVPTAAERMGDFSNADVQLYNPLSESDWTENIDAQRRLCKCGRCPRHLHSSEHDQPAIT